MNKLALIAALLLPLCDSSCSPDSPQEKERYDTFAFAERHASVEVYDSFKLSLLVGNEGATYDLTADPLQIGLASRKPLVAQVDSDGTVLALSAGSTWIVASSSLSSRKDSMLVVVSPVTPDKKAFKTADWGWTDIDGGASYGYARVEMFNSVQQISIVRYPEGSFNTTLVYNTGTSCVTVPVAANDVGATVAINGTYFDMVDYFSTSTHWDGEKLVATSDPGWEATVRSTGILGFKYGAIDICAYDASTMMKHGYDKFIASGPLMILDGKLQNIKDDTFNTSRHPRSMIGVDADRTVYLVVADGRFAGKAAGMSISELATIAGYLGLTDALNLDGGGSSTLWVNQDGVLNYPCGNSTWDHSGCRRCPTVIVATPRL